MDQLGILAREAHKAENGLSPKSGRNHTWPAPCTDKKGLSLGSSAQKGGKMEASHTFSESCGAKIHCEFML